MANHLRQGCMSAGVSGGMGSCLASNDRRSCTKEGKYASVTFPHRQGSMEGKSILKWDKQQSKL
jgi:hypothetical protein